MTTLDQVPLRNRPSDLVRAHLSNILESDFFRSSPRCSKLLQYSVEQVLGGCKTEDLKERVLGFELFNRRSGYDPAQDNIVRTAASDVRKRLAQYYNKFGYDNLFIELPLGSYAVVFHWREEQIPSIADSNGLPKPIEGPKLQDIGSKGENADIGTASKADNHSSHHMHLDRALWLRPSRKMLAVCAVLIAAVTTILIIRSVHASTDPILKVWSPLLNSGRPVLVCIAEPDAWIQAPDVSSNTKESFVHLTDAFVGVGDAYALAQVIKLLDSRNTAWRLLASNDASSQDLRSSPAVLIGAFSNRWSSRVKGEGRFSFNEAKAAITDNSNPQVSWMPMFQTADWKSADDYALVSGFLSPETGQPTISLAGITNYGTEGAADFVTNSELLRNALKQAPPGWHGQSFQFVLHMSILGNTPSPPIVVARYFW